MRKLLIGLVVLIVAVVAFDFLAPHTAARVGLTLERMRCGLEAKTLQVGEMEIAYLEGGPAGKDVETVVLVHGFGADKDNFTRASAYLTDQYHVVVPDLPGFGDSTRLMDASYTIEAQVARLHGILQAMDLERFHMGGSSMGGAITAVYAATYPDEVLSAWLLAPGGVAGARDSELSAAYKETGESLLVAEKPEDFARILDLATEKEPFLPYSARYVLAERAASDYELHKRIFEELAQDAPINSKAGSIQAPTLIVWGDKDRALDVSGAAILHDIVPDSQLIVMQGIGHLPMVEVPKQAAMDYLAFLEGKI